MEQTVHKNGDTKVGRHVKRHSTSLTVKEPQIKPMRYHFASIRAVKVLQSNSLLEKPWKNTLLYFTGGKLK